MKKYSLILLILTLLTSPSFAVTFSGSNLPYDSTFHLGLVNGPGTGVGVGADIFFPLEGVSLGGDIEQQVTNSEFEQNINILKYGIALKYVVSEDFYMTVHWGTAGFYVSKSVDYRDSFSGEEFTIDEDTHGNATYWAFCPSFRVGEYYVMPKMVINNITGGGSLSELDLNVGHKF